MFLNETVPVEVVAKIILLRVNYDYSIAKGFVYNPKNHFTKSLCEGIARMDELLENKDKAFEIYKDSTQDMKR